MKLVHVRQIKGTFIPGKGMTAAPSNGKNWQVEVQDGEKAYRSLPLGKHDVQDTVTNVVMSILASITSSRPILHTALVRPNELEKPLKNGIGLSDDHKELVVVTKGKVEVLYKDSRWSTAKELIRLVGKAQDDGRYLTGEWKPVEKKND